MRTTELIHLMRPLVLTVALAGALLAAPAAAQDTGAAEAPAAEPEIDPAMDWGDRPARPARPVRADPNAAPAAGTPGAEPTVSFGIFSEPVQLTTLIDFVGDILRLNIVVKGSPTGEIVFNAPVSVPESKLLDLLDAMLEQYGFTITSESDTGFYIVQPVTDVRPSVGGARSSVRIIPTPNIKPSQLVTPLTTVLGTGSGATNTVQAVDELGVIIVSAPSRDIARVEAMVAELMRIDAMQQFIRFELRHIAAPAALSRAVGLVAGSGTAATQPITNQGGNRNIRELQAAQQGVTASGGTFSNLADRMTVDPQGNALIFRGTDVEIGRVRSVLEQIDVPNTLEPKNYFAGSSATQIANMAKSRGLGEVIEVTDPNSSQFGDLNIQIQRGLQQGLGQNANSSGVGGPVMVVDASRGSIIYYGTSDQQKQLDNLMKELRTEDERIVIREYVLNHSDSETVADLITGLITGQRQTGDAPLLPTSRGVNRLDNTFQQNRVNLFNDPGSSGDDVSAAFDPDVVSVLADPENNQVIVKAPVKQQDEIAKLIDRLDRRRAQVYIQAMIVSITDNEDFTLAFETQLKAGQFGVNTNFGLSSFATGTGFGDAKSVATSLGGLTAAVIQSEYVPIIINATQTNTDVRILSSPQLLVNDNEEAEIVSIEEQPFSTTNVGQTTDTTTFGGFAEAGTTLRVTPSISDGGFLRLEYYVELSNFTAASGIDGNPPPRNTRRVDGKATIPSDATIVVGGLTVDDIRDTIIKVPFLGDIPLLGELFKKTNKVNNKAKLYVFLTPRIMTDPNFNDLKLLTEGPQATMQLDPDAPVLEPAPIRSTLPNNQTGAPQLEPVGLD